MTYRQDSDFFRPYGFIQKCKNHTSDETEFNNFIQKFGEENLNLVKSKSKPVAWFVSNCESKSQREEYVRELQKFIQVVQSTVNLLFK